MNDCVIVTIHGDVMWRTEAEKYKQEVSRLATDYEAYDFKMEWLYWQDEASNNSASGYNSTDEIYGLGDEII